MTHQERNNLLEKIADRCDQYAKSAKRGEMMSMAESTWKENAANELAEIIRTMKSDPKSMAPTYFGAQEAEDDNAN